MAVIETVTFRLADGVDEAAFLEADEEIRTGFLYHQPGMARATTARGDDGEWIVLVLWASPADADAAARAAADNPAAQRFSQMAVAPAKKRYHTLD